MYEACDCLAVQAGIRAEDFAAAAQSCATTLAMRWGCTASDRHGAQASAAAGSMPPASADIQANGSDSSSAAGGQAAVDEGYCMSCRPNAAASVGSSAPPPVYDVEALQLWLLQCCQAVSCAFTMSAWYTESLYPREAYIVLCRYASLLPRAQPMQRQWAMAIAESPAAC